MSHIYDYIAEMKARPGMYTTDNSLFPLEMQLYGYVACLLRNGILETYEGRKFEPGEFAHWLWEELGWSGSMGFAFAITEHSSDSETALVTFFELVDRFRYGSQGN